MFRGRLLTMLAMSAMPLAVIPTASQAQVSIGISVHIGPPALPYYVQPPIPAPNYIWAPGYWAWDDWWGDYYWVPGTWVMAPRPGLLWTPGYWGWNDGAYFFHTGYWGPHVGWYGGISYGFGYTGSGYYGGEWRGGNFFYNNSVNNVGNTHITNVYHRTVVNNTTIINNRNISYSGGPGGVTAQPNAEQRMAMNEQHIAATPQQTANNHAAQANRASFASVNRGRPAEPAVSHPRPAPAGPIHPAGMVRPAPGGGMPGPGTRGAVRAAPGAQTLRNAAPGMPRAMENPERPEQVRPEQSRYDQARPEQVRQREGTVPGTAMPDAQDRPDRSRPVQTRPNARPMERSDEGNFGGGAREDRAPPRERSYQQEPRPAPRPPSEPHYAPPPHHSAPPPEHRAPPPEHRAPPPHEDGGGQRGGGKDEHRHD